MSREIHIWDQVAAIIGLRPKEDVDPVAATLEASLKAMRAASPAEPAATPTRLLETPQRPSWRPLATAITLLSTGMLTIVLLSGRTEVGPRVPTGILPTATALPAAQPASMPTVMSDPQQVTLSPIALYGDYDEGTRIGQAPEGIVCTIVGRSPDNLWAFLACPTPTGRVWAKAAELKLSQPQADILRIARLISRIVPTAAAFTSPHGSGPALAFCADRESTWGKTHQCAASQAAADTLADSEIGRINATAEAIQRNATQ